MAMFIITLVLTLKDLIILYSIIKIKGLIKFYLNSIKKLNLTFYFHNI